MTKTEITSVPPILSVFMIVGGDNLDIEECTRAIGIEPTEVWCQTKSKLPDLPGVEKRQWIFGIEKKECYSVSEMLDELMEVLWPLNERIINYLNDREISCSFVCNVTIYEDRPLYSLSPGVMEKMASLGAEFLMDIFDYSE